MPRAIEEVGGQYERAPARGRGRFGRDGAESERVFIDLRLAAAWLQARKQRQMPEKLAGSGAHRGIVEAVSEPAATVEELRGAFQLGLARGRAVQQPLIVVGPDLRVACHRLAVEPEIVWIGGEERDRDRIRERAVADQGLVTRRALPSVCARDVRNDAMGTCGPRLAGIVFVEPARLGNPNRVALLYAGKEMQERNLRGAR